MIVAIFADGVRDPRTGAAGWGAWLGYGAGGDQIVKRHGIIDGDPQTHTGAELAAMAAALEIACRELRITRHDTVIVHTDCRNAIDVVTRRWADPRSPFILGRRARIDALREVGFALDFRSVRLHRRPETPETMLLHWAYKRARDGMFQARGALAADLGRSAA